MRTCQYQQDRQKGFVLVLVAVLLLGLMAVLSLAVDVGYLYLVRTDLQTAADAAALAGASGLGYGEEEAFSRACEYARKNLANNAPVILQEPDVQSGLWDPSTRVFTPLDPEPEVRPNALRVMPRLNSDRGTAVNLFLANVLDIDSMNVTASAVALLGPRDIVLTLDYSASMNYDSQIRHIPNLGADGQQEVEQSLRDIWVALGSPQYGNMQFTPVRNISSNYSAILAALGLTGVPYPYPQSAYMDSGGAVRTCTRTWSDYFDYVRGIATERNEQKRITDTRYRWYYGYLTLMDYFQAVQYRATPDAIPLWQTPEEPITAVKDAVTLFLDFMQEQRTDDRIGLASYTYGDGEGRLEQVLTDDYALIESTSRHRQAGHYHNQTNIAAGIEEARGELQTRGRARALQLIVLLSDGKANWHGNSNDPSGARDAALAQARLAAADGILILTISLGADADLDLMEEIAEITGGLHFVVPGGDDVDDYRDQLFEVFDRIAHDRPLKLVD